MRFCVKKHAKYVSGLCKMQSIFKRWILIWAACFKNSFFLQHVQDVAKDMRCKYVRLVHVWERLWKSSTVQCKNRFPKPALISMQVLPGFWWSSMLITSKTMLVKLIDQGHFGLGDGVTLCLIYNKNIFLNFIVGLIYCKYYKIGIYICKWNWKKSEWFIVAFC